MMEQNLISNHRVCLEMLHNDLMAVNGVIEAMLDKDPVKCLERTEHVDTKGVLTAFEFRHALSMIILASAKDSETRCRLEGMVESDATYFLEKVIPRLPIATDIFEWNFLVELCQLILRMLSFHLSSNSHSTHYKKVVADRIAMLTTKNTSSVFIVPVLKALKDLCRALDEVEDEKLVEKMVVPLMRSCLIWMSERVEDDDFHIKESAESFLGMVNALKIMKKLSRDVLDMYAKVIIASTTPVLLKVNKDGNGRFAFVCGHVECLGQAIRHERYFLRLQTLTSVIVSARRKREVECGNPLSQSKTRMIQGGRFSFSIEGCVEICNQN
uniref:HEAT repeat-containing protein 1 n=1 Tax=Parascaris univalens TaxID=6257 RepID=A0A914ZZI0_PARUN